MTQKSKAVNPMADARGKGSWAGLALEARESNNGCPDMLDPSELDVTFRKNILEVWIKYLGLRRQNRCDRNVPVDILEIRKR